MRRNLQALQNFPEALQKILQALQFFSQSHLRIDVIEMVSLHAPRHYLLPSYVLLPQIRKPGFTN